MWSEWANLLIRWVHVIAGIMWIGDSLLFNFLDRHFEKPKDGAPGVAGEVWMIHSGGYYHLLKKPAPDRLPDPLHWFRWEAGTTWLTGFALLWVVYYLGGILVDPTSSLSNGAAIGIGTGTLLLAWVVYDGICQTRLPDGVKAAVLFCLAGAVAFGLSRVFTGRAMFLHVGAMFGTLMVANVWMRIIPAQKEMIAATKAGRAPDPAFGERAKLRSKHNTYMTYPVIFIMISNHFPTTYGHELNWLVLMLFVVAGAGARHLVIAKSRYAALWGAVVAAALVTLAVMTS